MRGTGCRGRIHPDIRLVSGKSLGSPIQTLIAFLFRPITGVKGQYRFYEKVIKVKADVAAILVVFHPPFTASPSESTAEPMRSDGDRARGRSPLAGGVAAWAVPAVLAGTERGATWGEPSPPRLSPLGETGKGESNSLLPPGYCYGSLFWLQFSIPLPVIRDSLASSTLAALLFALSMSLGGSVHVGVRSSPRSITVVTDLGCQGAAI